MSNRSSTRAPRSPPSSRRTRSCAATAPYRRRSSATSSATGARGGSTASSEATSTSWVASRRGGRVGLHLLSLREEQRGHFLLGRVDVADDDVDQRREHRGDRDREQDVEAAEEKTDRADGDEHEEGRETRCVPEH